MGAALWSGAAGEAGECQEERTPGWACADWPSGEQGREEARFLALQAFRPVGGPAFSADSTLTSFWWALSKEDWCGSGRDPELETSAMPSCLY